MSVGLVAIYNLALSKAGTRSSISSPTDKRREAELCNQFYPYVFDMILAAHYWPSAKAVANLQLVSQANDDGTYDDGDPEPPWYYAWAQPADCVRPRFLTTFETFTTGQINGQAVIFTNVYQPILVYTKRIDVPPDNDVLLKSAVVSALAGHITEPLTGRANTARAAIEQANATIMQAQVEAANEKESEYESIPDWLLARGVSGGTGIERYFFPVGPLLASI